MSIFATDVILVSDTMPRFFPLVRQPHVRFETKTSAVVPSVSFEQGVCASDFRNPELLLVK